MNHRKTNHGESRNLLMLLGRTCFSNKPARCRRGPAYSLVLALFLAACSSTPKLETDPCLKRRGAIDIGSGSTKALAAIVDVCQKPVRIVEKLFDEKVKISFSESVEQSPTSEISAEVAADASAKIATFVEKIDQFNVERLELVATAAFRKAQNGSRVAIEISDALQKRRREAATSGLKVKSTLKPESLRVRILSQEEEAQIGARSAMANLPPSTHAEGAALADAIVVWDIGGGSMQMLSTLDSAPIFTGDLASVTFKNRVIKEVQKKDPASVKSPNPLRENKRSQNHRKAVSIARDHAQKNVRDEFKKIGATARWVGIGGVLATSVKKQVEQESTGQRRSGIEFTARDLEKTFETRAGRKDLEIDSDYRETEITNLALVLGYMQELKISQVETVEASLVQGLVAK